MSIPSEKPRRRRLAWVGLALVLLLILLARGLPPNGREHAESAQFFGRFHPLIVHLPIALLLVVPLMDLAGSFRRWSHLRAAAGFVLWLAAAGALAAAFDGWLLAWSGGYNGGLVNRHLWSGVGLAALAVITAFVRSRILSGQADAFDPKSGVKSISPTAFFALLLVYWPLLLAAVALMFWTGHQGGEISHGDDYLTQYMPARLRVWLSIPATEAHPVAPVPVPTTVYAARIAPLLERSCVSCHNARKSKGKLRLDSYAMLMRGGEDGLVIAPWDPQNSELIRRVTLPADDDDSMPSDGRMPFTPAEVKLFEQWISAGASPAQPLSTLR